MAVAELVPTQAVSGASRPIRVAHVSLTLKTGGLERILADLARHVDRDRYHLEFIALRETGRFADEIRDAGWKVHDLQSRSRWQDLSALRQLFHERQIDIVHTHNTYPHLYGTLAARWAGVPIVLQTRHGQRAGHGWKSRVQYRLASRWCNQIIAVSDDAATLCVESDGIPPSKVRRIWNGIDTDQFRWTPPAVAPHAISVARLSPEKDFPTLLAAVRTVAPQVPGFRLTIVGHGPDREKLEATVKDWGLTGQIHFLGERADVPELLAQSAFFVTATLTEGISLTLLEAMAVGRAVIATAVGGNPEIVVDGQTGMLVPPRSVERLAEAMVEMCHHPERWRDWGVAGRDRVLEHFDVRRMAEDYEQVYAEFYHQASLNR